jgi:ABC-type multidrug transport system fused ATPase/permease subunit
VVLKQETKRMNGRKRFSIMECHHLLLVLIIHLITIVVSKGVSSSSSSGAITTSPFLELGKVNQSNGNNLSNNSSSSTTRNDRGLSNETTVTHEILPPPPPLLQQPFGGMVEKEVTLDGDMRRKKKDGVEIINIPPPPPPIVTNLLTTKSDSTIISATSILPPPPSLQQTLPPPPSLEVPVYSQQIPPPNIRTSSDDLWKNAVANTSISLTEKQQRLDPKMLSSNQYSQVPYWKHQQEQLQSVPSHYPKAKTMIGKQHKKGKRGSNKAQKVKLWFRTVSSGMKVVSDALDKSLDSVVDQTSTAWSATTKKLFTQPKSSSLEEYHQGRKYQQQPFLHSKGSAVKYLRNGGDSSSSSHQKSIYTNSSTTFNGNIPRDSSSYTSTTTNQSEESLPPHMQQQIQSRPSQTHEQVNIQLPQERRQQHQQYPMTDNTILGSGKSSFYNQKDYQPKPPRNRQEEEDTRALSQPKHPQWQQQHFGVATTQRTGTSDTSEKNIWQQSKDQYNYFDDTDGSNNPTLLRKIKNIVLRDIPELIVGPFQIVYSKVFRNKDFDEYGSIHEDSWATSNASTTAISKWKNPFTWIRSYLGFSMKEDEEWSVRPKRQASPQKIMPPTTTDNRVPKKVLDLILTTSNSQQVILSIHHNNKNKYRHRSTQKCYPLVPLDTVKKCKAIGRNQAFMDVVALTFTLIAFNQLGPYLSMILCNGGNKGLRCNGFNNNFETWAPFALCAAWLTAATNHLDSQPKLSRIKAKVKEEVGRSIEYAQLWLRLITSVETQDSYSSETSSLAIDASHIASSQIDGIVARRRLRFFTTIIILGGFLIRYTAFLAQLGQALLQTIVLLFLPLTTTIRSSTSASPSSIVPILVTYLKEAFKPLRKIIQSTIWEDELWVAMRKMNLSKVALQVSLPLALLLSSFLPILGRNVMLRQLFDGKSTKTTSKASLRTPGRHSVVDSDTTSSLLHRSHVASLGSCSSSRLQLLSQDSVDAVLDRWQMLQPSSRNTASAASIQASILDFNWCLLLKWSLIFGVAVLSTLPLSLVAFYGSEEQRQLSNMLSMTLMLLSNFWLTKRAIDFTMSIPVGVVALMEFISSLGNTVDELFQSTSVVKRTSSQHTASMAAYSPKKGISVTDLWAAHSAKRAWAVQGANFKCKSGELVLILGDEGSGKTRLLTAIAELLLEPPKRARSTTLVRGKVHVGGVDSLEWDRSQLRHYIGVVLNDVGCVAKAADLVSGSSLEDILDPSSGGRSGQREKAAVAIALQVCFQPCHYFYPNDFFSTQTKTVMTVYLHSLSSNS